MIINVDPEIGGTALCFGRLKKDNNNQVFVETIIGTIVDIRDDDTLVIKDINYTIPIHRVKWFTFGGIEVVNYKFDYNKMAMENKLMFKSLYN